MEKSSLWLHHKTAPAYPALQQNIETDVCIIGGGITGITTAWLLQRKGFTVALVEAKSIAGGVTGHTSGHLTSMVDSYYHNIITSHNIDTAIKVRQATTAARDLAEEIITSNFIDADFKRVTGHYFAADKEQMDVLEKERIAMREAGFDISSLFVWRFPFEILGGFCLPGQAIIDAPAFVRGLAKKCNGTGVRIFEDTRIDDFARKAGRWQVSSGNSSISAKYLVQATHTPLGFNPVQMEMKPMHSYVIAGKPAGEAVPGLFYDMATPYHYIRNYEYRGEKLLIIGGSDSKPGDKIDQHRKMDQLIEYATQNFQLKDVIFSWGSMYFEPADGLPYIGHDPLHDNAFISTGYSGDGLTFGMVGAILISELIEKGDHPWKRVFEPSRLNLSALSEVIKENASVIKNFVGERLRLSTDYIPHLEKGNGTVLKVDGKKIGISMDAEGSIHAVDPVCTHMGCILNWNSASQTWDCGCHGSRFNATGEVVAGPATKELNKIEVEHESPVEK